ncbi:reduced coenzyme F420:NADP oxidoreductase [Actinomadura meyerae]|uniref:Reduced coenzyme F420:NADP oxidoreductase n=1 Tax=Actinomadura meyerae TaxID=240840 RepID=A0A239C4M5_9ACTN|nr:NADPH-dependent F420 reductase [Actinomadura meyerae]SNS15136.1 reduced coenzyme F420:NADP oxidoreductase [Actinomadura meyerae]
MTEQQQKTPYDLPDVGGLSIGILGGTGDQGKGLARRFALAGHEVTIGSRRAERAQAAADELAAEDAALRISGAENPVAAGRSDIVVVAVPWDGHKATLESLREELAGKVVVDCVNPLGFEKGKGAFALPVEEGSAAEQAAAVLPDSRVVAAFHHVSAKLLLDPGVDEMELDVLVLGNDREATDTVQALAGRIPGMRGVYGGRLHNAHQVEAFTANLISMNRRYKAHAGLRITDV